MRVAIAQMNSRPGDFSQTASRMVAHAQAAAARGAGLVVFPVPVLTGPDPWSAGETEEYLADLMACLDGLAAGLACPALVPFALASTGGPYFEAILVADGHVIALSPLATGGQVPQGEWSSQGEGPAFVPRGFSLDGLRVGVAFDQDELRALAASGARLDAICYLESRCFCSDDETTVLAASVADGGFAPEASQAGAWLVAVGPVGGYDTQVFCGGSFVMAPWGELAWAAPAFEEALGVADVDPLFEGPLPEPVEPVPYSRMDHLWGALALAIRDFAHKQGVLGAVVPLVGGVCDCAVAALAADALGPTHVHALVCDMGDPSALEDARKVVRSLRVASTEVPAAAPLEAAAALGFALPAASPQAPVVRRELLGAAMRCVAAAEGSLVLSAADKTALALDPLASHVPGADYAPLGDLYRTDVVSLMRRRAATSAAVPQACLGRLAVPPALAGLGSDLGIGDAELVNRVDALLYLHVERGVSLSGLVRDQGDDVPVEDVLALLDGAERERRGVTCLPMVSERALFERRVPLGSAWRDRLRDESEAEDVGGRLVSMVSGRMDVPNGPMPVPFAQGDLLGLSEEASRQVEGLMGMLQDMLQNGSLEQDGVWGDGLFSEN